jgi:hypothetical protein
MELNRHFKWLLPILLLPPICISYLLLHFFSSPPTVEIEMSPSVFSRAQVYWNVGAGMSEVQSSSQPVRGGNQRQLLSFPIPNGILLGLRFDPLTSPGTIVIHRATLRRSDGSALSIDLHSIRGLIGFDEEVFQQEGVKYHVRHDSFDSQMAIDLKYPIDLRSTYPGDMLMVRIVASGVALLFFELLLFIWEPAFIRTRRLFAVINASFSRLAARLSSNVFIQFDRVAIWFYFTCLLSFVIAVLLDLNGSSIGIDWFNYNVGAPPRVLAGVPQGIRADEIYYQTPYMMNQYFRLHPFELAKTGSGSQNVGLLAELPVKHVTTWFRPQFWPFFILPGDYAFSAWWQAKGLILATGVFTLMLLITGSSWLSLVGTLWLLFSQFTQWCYSWPSMLPEMCGLLCFTIVFALYLTVGRSRFALGTSAFAAAACAVNFALTSYVPHEIPYAWVGVFLTASWMFGHRREITRRDGSIERIAASGAFVFLTVALMLVVLHDTSGALAGIADTVYPGHRLLDGGGFGLSTIATHFLAASENATRFPPEFSNINEASGFLWLAPVSLFCLGRMRSLRRDRQVLLASLWAIAILLASWMLLPIPASVGRFMFLDHVQGVRVLPALGLLNMAIVMLVLSAPDQGRRRIGSDTRFTIIVPLVFGALVLANQSLHDYFRLSELLLGGLWAACLAFFLVDGHLFLFSAAVVIPNVLLFAVINPVERGIPTITASPLFDLVQQNQDLRQGKWIVFSDGFPSSIFSAVGCNVFNGMRYLPDLQDFPVLAAHGVDTSFMNNLGYVSVEQLEGGQSPEASRGVDGSILSVDPLDPLLKELGIRYMAFHKLPPPDVLDHLEPLIDGTVSEFWIYRLK